MKIRMFGQNIKVRDYVIEDYEKANLWIKFSLIFVRKREMTGTLRDGIRTCYKVLGSKIFIIDEYIDPPVHFNCRSKIFPSGESNQSDQSDPTYEKII